MAADDATNLINMRPFEVPSIVCGDLAEAQRQVREARRRRERQPAAGDSGGRYEQYHIGTRPQLFPQDADASHQKDSAVMTTILAVNSGKAHAEFKVAVSSGSICDVK